MKELTLQRNTMNVRSVERSSNLIVLCKHMKELTQERNLMCVNIVVKPTFLTNPFKDTQRYILAITPY